MRLLSRIASGLLLAPVVAALLLPTPRAEAAPGPVFYVDCSAKQPGTGTLAHPWNRLEDVAHHGDFGPGNQILLKRHTTCDGRLAPTGSGVATHPILIGAYGKGGKPTVRGGGTGSWTGAVQLNDQEYWTVQDLHVTNTDGKRSTDPYRSGVLIVNNTDRMLHGVTVRRMAVDHVNSNMSSLWVGPRSFGGISAITMGGVKGGFDRLTIRDNVVSQVGRTGIVTSNNSYPSARDTRVRVAGNHVSQTRGDGIVMLGAYRGRVDHNVSAYAANEWPCPECGGITRFTANVAIWTGSSNGVRIDHNEAYGTKWIGGDGEGFDVDSGAVNTVVEYNYAHGNDGGGILFCGSKNTIARFNILEDNSKSAIAFIGTAPATNTQIYNNTIYQSKKSDAGTVRYFNGPKGKGIRFFNNLIYNHAKGYWLWPTKVRSASNTYVGAHKPGEPHGPGWSRTDPGLRAQGTGAIGRSTLKGYKPARADSFRPGKRIPKSVKVDFFGKKINPKHPPRGAAG